MQRLLLAAVLVGCAVASLSTVSDVVSVASPGSEEDAVAAVQSLNATLYALYKVCTADVTCSSRFYLGLSLAFVGNKLTTQLQTPTEELDFRKFARLAVQWAFQDDCPLRETSMATQLTLSDFRAEDAGWWLRLMNTAKFCDDNEVWLIKQGCVCQNDKSCRVSSRVTSYWEENSLTLLTVFAFGVIVVGSVVGDFSLVVRFLGETRLYVETAFEQRGNFAVKETVDSLFYQPDISETDMHVHMMGSTHG